MKKISIISFALLICATCFSQVVRDHRNGKKTPYKPASPTQPPPVAATHRAGPPVTSIDPNKWYYIKRADTKKYMMIAGHKDPSRSMAYLAIEEMQQDNTSQQWRFVAVVDGGSTIYKLQNRKYTGDLLAVPVGLYMDLSRNRTEAQQQAFSFMMVLNPDKSWYMLTRGTDNKCALSSIVRNSSHCHPYYDEPVIGGRVIADSECTNTVRSDFVYQPVFTGKSDQKWVLEEVREK